jgi:hypothetical protein
MPRRARRVGFPSREPDEVVAALAGCLGAEVDVDVAGEHLPHGEERWVVLLRRFPGPVLPDDEVPNPTPVSSTEWTA